MLRGLRTVTSGWLGKTTMAGVVGFLVISFAIWGIGDIFRGFGRGSVASVGSVEISIEQFRSLFTDRVQALGRQLRRPITPEQARAFGVDQQVLSQWMQDAALDQRARKLRLGISDAEVVRRITEDPAFRGASGQFDPTRFTGILRQIGYTEQSYVAEQRRETLRRQITTTVSGDVKPPKTAAEAVNRYENEQRDIDYVVLGRAQAGAIPPPAPEEGARTIEIGAPDIKAFYDKNMDRFSTPEKRQVQQMLFNDKDEAHKAAERLGGGPFLSSLSPTAQNNESGPP